MYKKNNKKKAAILTINDISNLVNRLQNFALQEVLKKHNLQVETIKNQKLEKSIKKIKDIMKRIFKINSDICRYNNFQLFEKNIRYSKYTINHENQDEKIGNEYDYFFTGSDQVWNHNFKRMSDIDFLQFVPMKKRNSFSASFGVETIPDELFDYYNERLKDFKNISVREESGKKIIKAITNRDDVEVLVDPTMLLTKEEWDKVCKKPKKMKSNKYILNYFLGELSQSRKDAIKEVALKYNCDIINILDPKSDFYECGPSEFLYLEKNAFLICTDSFHSSVFAVIYDRPFVIFNREDNRKIDMSSRLENLINKLNLKNRKFNGENITIENIESDYTEAFKILSKEKEKANNFIKKVLNNEERKGKNEF